MLTEMVHKSQPRTGHTREPDADPKAKHLKRRSTEMVVGTVP